jgi:hypothetical protein
MLAKSPVWGIVTALDFLRLIGHAGSLSSVVGGGGRGDELISPIRRSVKVSWAFVGTPFRSVLGHDSVRGVALQMMGRLMGIHVDIELLLPVWKFAVEKIRRVGESRCTEEGES